MILVACGTSVDPPREAPPPERLVALAPNLVEIVFELGLGERLVGVGDHVQWPPEVRSLPRLGGLYDPHLEEIVQLEPDLALLLPSEAELGRKLARLGVDSLEVPVESLADVERALVSVAERCGVAERGRKLATEWTSELSPHRVAPGRRVLLVVGRPAGNLREIYVAGPETFLSELLERLGGINVFADLELFYSQVGLDAIVARAPDVIVELQGETIGPEHARSLRADWERLLPIPPPVVILAGSHVLVPGPRIPQLYRELKESLAVSASEPDS